MPTDDPILDAVKGEILSRLTAEPCPSCGRGKEADSLAATALAKMYNDGQRMRLAGMKNEGNDEPQEGQLNPLSLVAAVDKLPADHPKRGEFLEMLRGQIIALQDAERRLSAEPRETVST